MARSSRITNGHVRTEGECVRRRALAVSMIVGFMITCSVVTVAAKSKVYRSSNHLDSDYVQLTTTDNGMIRVEGRTVVGKERFALVLAGPEALDILFTGAVRRDGSYGREYDASTIRSGKFNELRIAFRCE